MHFSTIIYRSDLVIPGTKSSLYVEEIFEFSDILYGTVYTKLAITVATLLLIVMTFLFHNSSNE